MSILKAVERAYRVMEERDWDTIYWAVDLHGVCLKSNYQQGGYEWINEDALRTLQLINRLSESKIILWSSVYEEEKKRISRFFNGHGIILHGFNDNVYEKNNKVSSFDQKFYFSVLLDDKAGFDPETDWQAIGEYLTRRYEGNRLLGVKPYYAQSIAKPESAPVLGAVGDVIGEVFEVVGDALSSTGDVCGSVIEGVGEFCGADIGSLFD
jgi:hypothetical protein